MMRFKRLSELNRPDLKEISLATLPQDIFMTRYAMQKAFKINELVREIHHESYEWYGYTLASADNPQVITDIGLPRNTFNFLDHTALGPEGIADFQENIPGETVINGWIHSHGKLEYKHFSSIDAENSRTVLDFVGARIRKPVAKKEIAIKDLVLLVKNRFTDRDFEKGSVALITDQPITEAVILETVFGSFCYSIVIGDEGWHRQEIFYRERGILSGSATVSSREAKIVFDDTGKTLGELDISALSAEVATKIKPHTDPPPELIERM